MKAMTKKPRLSSDRAGFSLIEVVLALGLTSFALLTMLGLFSVGLQDVSDSERKVEAANALSSLLETRLAAPAKAEARDALPALDPKYLPLKGTAYISPSGSKADEGDARFRLTYEILPDADSAASSTTRLIRVHLLASWPAGVDPAKSAGTSEMLTSTYVNL